jgi:hypothetical protein
VFVCDAFNYRVQAFDVSDRGLEVRWVYGGFGLKDDSSEGRGGGDRSFDLPVSVATDDEGYVFVLDGMGAAVVTLEGDTGEAVTLCGTVGPREGQLLYPASLAYGDGRIWVVDQGNARVSVFSQSEVAPAARLVRQHIPTELFWLAVLFLCAIEIGCLTWLACIRPTRILLSMDALERIGAREKGAVIAGALERIIVPAGIEAFAGQVCGGATVGTAPRFSWVARKLEEWRDGLSSLDYDVLVAARSTRGSVLVVDDYCLLETALEMGISVIDTAILVREADSVLTIE